MSETTPTPKAKFCPFCGFRFTLSDYEFCPGCGQPQLVPAAEAPPNPSKNARRPAPVQRQPPHLSSEHGRRRTLARVILIATVGIAMLFAVSAGVGMLSEFGLTRVELLAMVAAFCSVVAALFSMTSYFMGPFRR